MMAPAAEGEGRRPRTRQGNPPAAGGRLRRPTLTRPVPPAEEPSMPLLPQRPSFWEGHS